MTNRSISFVLMAGVSVAVVAASLVASHKVSAETVKLVPPPVADEAAKSTPGVETAVFAGGCFWGVQGVFQHVKGVTSAVSGYSGGKAEDASYPTVSSGTTGHAESVKVTYDPSKVTYGKLLQIYFSVVADPTTLNAQGPDEGTQYRTDIFTLTSEQHDIATRYIAQLQKARAFEAPIVTAVTPFKAFYPAEAYHQNFLTTHPTYPYIAINDMPKVEGLKALFGDLYRPEPALTASASN